MAETAWVKNRLVILPENITNEEFQKFEYQQISVLEHTAYSPISKEFYILETQSNKSFDTFILNRSSQVKSETKSEIRSEIKSEIKFETESEIKTESDPAHTKSTMFADTGTIIFKKINPIFVSLPTLLPYTEKFIPYDQLPKPWNNFELITKLHENNSKIIEIKKVEIDEDDILHTFKLNMDNLLVFLTEKLEKLAENREIIGQFAADPKYSAIQVLKEFVPVEIIKLLADKLGISLVRVKAEKIEHAVGDEENEEPEKKKVKVEVEKISKLEKKLQKIDKKGLKKMTNFFKVVAKKKK